MIPGADQLAATDWELLSGRRIGVITNPTGILQSTLGGIVDAMADSRRVEIAAVFGPEHGFRGTAQAGASEDTGPDPRTGITVHDAYGADADVFGRLFAAAGIDTVVYDLQDVGARFYTYLWTLYEAMTAAARAGLEVVVLDRPNPVGGRANGPLLQPGFRSAVGRDQIVQAHGMTVGELAGFVDGEFLPDRAGRRLEALRVVPVQGWDGSRLFADTGLTWVPPSPNMPTPETALLYNGTGLFEATNLSEGRGTTRPFELIGAPYVDRRWAAALATADLPGVRFRDITFTPTSSTHAGRVCGGVQVHLTDPHRVDAISTATHMITSLRDLYDDFDWRDEGDEGDEGDGSRIPWIDLLTGSDRFRRQLAAGEAASTMIDCWRDEREGFERRRRPYLLYPRPGEGAS